MPEALKNLEMAGRYGQHYPGRKRVQKQARMPMPTGGLNFIDNVADIKPNESYVMTNVIPRPFGLEVRKGWKYWVPQNDSLAGGARSIMAFDSEIPPQSRLFASAEATGLVYDISSQNVAPVLSLTPSTPAVNLGEWFGVNYATPGGNYWCMVANGAGYYVYNGLTGVWTEFIAGSGAGKIEFPAGDTTTTKSFSFCFVWKNRLWFLKQNSSEAYYLPINSISGKVEKFDFGPQLKHGGYLSYACNWTYDAGDGIDDSLVILGTQGDMLVYQGTDPASAANFQLKGVWYCGNIPPGRRGFCQHGGNVLIITEYGVTNIQDLVSGRIHSSEVNASLGYKINPILARQITANIDQKYWLLIPYPAEELLIIGSPHITPELYRTGLLMSSITNAWCTYQNMEIYSAAVWQGKFIFGTREGWVAQGFVGFQDNVPSDGASNGEEVTARIQNAFSSFESGNQNKRALRVKVYGLVDAPPSIRAIVVNEYHLGNIPDTSAEAAEPTPAWDQATWDQAVWKSGLSTYHQWVGVSCIGKKLSLQLAVRGAGEVILTDFELLYEEGIGL